MGAYGKGEGATLGERRRSRPLRLGNVTIGGGAPVAVQSMTTTQTADVAATLAQVRALAQAGADVVRLAVPDADAAKALSAIVPASPVPLVADIHFDWRLALAALAAGIHGVRLNPGNIGAKERVREVVKAARERSVPIRIGVNAGSLEKDIVERHGWPTAEGMVESAERHIRFLEDEGYREIKVSLKAHDVAMTVRANRLFAARFDYPLHLGVTEAGPLPGGIIKATAGIATLLAEGIGDTIRYSLTADPVEEARAGRTLLEALGLRERKGLDLIACPSCGRAEVDVIQVASAAQAALQDREIPLQVAVMGCVVNGPGEAREADLGIAAGRHRGHLFVKGQVVRVVPEDEMVDALVAEAERIMDEGIDAVLASADAGAQAAADADRDALLAAQGTDANHAGDRIDKIRDLTETPVELRSP
jgi:(E)-4-hydroxy-3-methylbut-2-enyl-diphosphate synthase